MGAAAYSKPVASAAIRRTISGSCRSCRQGGEGQQGRVESEVRGRRLAACAPQDLQQGSRQGQLLCAIQVCKG